MPSPSATAISVLPSAKSSPVCAETASPIRTVSERRSTGNSARAASAPSTRAITGLTIAPGLIATFSSSGAAAGAPAPGASMRPEGRAKRTLMLVPPPAAPLISKLSESEAISGSPRPRLASPSPALGRKPLPLSLTVTATESSSADAEIVIGPGPPS